MHRFKTLIHCLTRIDIFFYFVSLVRTIGKEKLLYLIFIYILFLFVRPFCTSTTENEKTEEKENNVNFNDYCLVFFYAVANCNTKNCIA